MNEPPGEHRPDLLPILWILARGVQVLVTVIYLKFAYISIGTESFVENAVSVVAMLLLIYFFLHRLVTGTTDSFGIHLSPLFLNSFDCLGGNPRSSMGRAPTKSPGQGKRQAKKKARLFVEPAEGVGTLSGPSIRDGSGSA